MITCSSGNVSAPAPAKQSFETTGISVVTCVSNRYDTRSWAGGYEEPLSAGSSSLGLPETSQCLQCCGSPQGIYASTVCDCCHLHKCRELSGLSTCVCADATEDFEKRFFKEISVRQDWLIQTCISLQHWLLPAYVRGGYRYWIRRVPFVNTTEGFASGVAKDCELLVPCVMLRAN